MQLNSEIVLGLFLVALSVLKVNNLLVAQGDHRVYLCGPSRGKVAGDYRHDRQE